MKKILKLSLNIFLLAALQYAKGQKLAVKDTVGEKRITVSSNNDYDKAGKLKRMLLGEHYRKEWATRVEVMSLNIDSFAGGLTPLRLGGGKQTKSLRLKAANGNEYVLRSINKDPSKAIPQELVGSFANDIVQDQISSSNPYAPLVVAALEEAAGIYHTHPQIVYVVQTNSLGNFNDAFANTLCLLEERPMGNQENNEFLDDSKKVVNSAKLFENIFGNNNHHVDERSFLKARLFDMWIGDWDRHEDQWMWASFKKDGETIYKPIPRDRDQAFSKLDGIIPQMAARPWMVRKTQNFDYTIRDINGLNMAGNALDRNFTVQLTLNDWMDVTTELQQKLTDQKIESAFTMMPENIFEISGKEIIAKLKKRRDDLKKYATTYYYFINKEVNIVGTAKNEYFEVNRENNDSTKVTMYKLNKENDVDEIIFQRTFLNKETKEIRLYGLGGNDKFNITGTTIKGTLVRVIGGDGADTVTDNSAVSSLSRKTRVYDSAAFVSNIHGEAKSFLSGDTSKNNYNRLELRYDWLAPKIAPGYNPDDGIYLGAGFTIKKRMFGKKPFGYVQSFWGNYAIATGAYNFAYEGMFREAIGKWDLNIDAHVNAPNYVVNYFGLGNETELYNDDKNYNRVRSNQWIFSPSVSRQWHKHHTFRIGAGYEAIKVEKSNGRFVTDMKSNLDSTVFERNHFANVSAAYQFNTTDNELYPTKGIKYNARFECYQNLKETTKHFGRVSSDASAYVSINALTAVFRIGWATNIGDDFEFYQANTLGGATNLRGYRKSRYAGKSSAYQNTELRWKLTNARGYYFRGNFGVLGFFDNGRVWMPGESSTEWHYGYGGGVWYMPYNMMSFTATYSISKEDQFIGIKAGFLF